MGNWIIILYWFFFRFKIPFLVRQRKFHGDLESFIVAGTIFANNIFRLKEKNKNIPITKTQYLNAKEIIKYYEKQNNI